MMKLGEEYNEALLGQCYHSERFIYSFEKVIQIFKKELEIGYQEALEYVEYNVVGARFEGEPIWMYKKE